VITFLGWLAALVALLTGAAMLGDTYLSRSSREQLVVTFRCALVALRHREPAAIDRCELAAAIRFILRAGVLVLIVASSGVAVFLPFGPGLTASAYEVLLRCGLASFMAMQVPCPWIHWILCGHQVAGDAQEGSHAH
jgi:hypothetical protein